MIVLHSINRLSTLTLEYVASNGFLRWVDINNMRVQSLISTVASYLLKKEIEYAGPSFERRGHLLLNLAFIIGVYGFAVSYRDHEVTNYLHARFCEAADTLDACCARS